MPHSIDLYLASQSPRRRDLLNQIGVRFEVINVDVPEQREHGETPANYVQRLSLSKAKAGADLVVDKPVLGADTIVVLEPLEQGASIILEKPGSEEEAIGMLLALSGRTHQVMTAVTIYDQSRSQTVLNQTSVNFRKIDPVEASRYWQTGEPVDKAGAYGIQGLGSVFVESINGSYSSVVGLPLVETAQLLNSFGVPIWHSSP